MAESVELERLVVKFMGEAGQYEKILQKAEKDALHAEQTLLKAAAHVEAAQSEMLTEGARLFAMTRTATEKHSVAMARISTLYQQGAISAQTYARAVKQVASEYGIFSKQMEQAGRNLQSIGVKMSMGVTAPIVAMGVAAAKEFTTFEDGLLAIKSVADPTEQQMQTLRDTAMGLSDELKIEPEKILAGYSELLKAGVSLEKVLGSTGEQAIKFAKVGELQTAESATVMADAMTVFKESAEDTVDTLSGAADASSVSIKQITDAFSQVSAVGGQANQSLEDVAAGIALLGKHGVKGSDAGTSLKTMLLRLMAPVDKGAEVFEQFNLQVRNADGSMKPLIGIIAELEKKFGGLNQVAKDKILSQLFGQDAIRAGSIFLNEGAQGLHEFTESIRGAQSVTAKYDILMSGMSGNVAEASAAFSRMRIELGEAISKTLGPFFEWLAKILDKTAEWIKENKNLATTLAGIAVAAAAVGPLLVATGTVLTMLPQMVAGYKMVNVALGLTPSLALAAKLGLAGLAVGGIIVLSKAIYDSMPSIKDFNKELERSADLSNKVNAKRAEFGAQTLQTAAKIEDPALRVKFLGNELTKAGKEAIAMNDQLNAANNRVMELNTTWKAGTGNKILEAAEQNAAEMNTRLEQQKEHVAQLQRAYKDAQAAKGTQTAMKSFESPGGFFTPVSDTKAAIEAATTPLAKYMAVQKDLKAQLDASEITVKKFNKSMSAAKREFSATDSDPVRQLTRNLEEQVKTFDMTAEQREIYRMQQLGATDAQLKEARAMQVKLTALEEEKKATEEATQLAEKQADKVKKARDEFEKPFKIDFSVTGVEAVRAGSMEALAAVEATRNWASSSDFAAAGEQAKQTLAARLGNPVKPAAFDNPKQVAAAAAANSPKVAASHEQRVEDLLKQIAENTKHSGEDIVLAALDL